jgi:hypothetical protein
VGTEAIIEHIVATMGIVIANPCNNGILLADSSYNIAAITLHTIDACVTFLPNK